MALQSIVCKLIGVPACVPMVLSDIHLARQHATVIAAKGISGDSRKEKKVAKKGMSELGIGKVLFFALSRTVLNECFQLTKSVLFVNFGRIGRIVYGTSRSKTSGLVRHTGSTLLAQFMFYPFFHEGFAYSCFEGDKMSRNGIVFTWSGFPLNVFSSITRSFTEVLFHRIFSHVLGLGDNHLYKSASTHALASFSVWISSVALSRFICFPIDAMRRRIIMQNVLSPIEKVDSSSGFALNSPHSVFKWIWSEVRNGVNLYDGFESAIYSSVLPYLVLSLSWHATRIIFHKKGTRS